MLCFSESDLCVRVKKKKVKKKKVKYRISIFPLGHCFFTKVG